MTSPYLYEKGKKTDSYIAAVEGDSLPTKEHILLQDFNDTPDIGDDFKTNKRTPSIKPKNGIVKDEERFGLTSDQVTDYREDTFWRVFRTFAHVLFWLLWICMLIGILVLILINPTCNGIKSEKEPEWFKKSLIYQMWTPSFRDSNGDGLGDLDGIKEKLANLERIGIDTIFPRPFLAFNKEDNEVTDYFNVSPDFGSLEDAQSLIEKVHASEMKIVIEIPIAVTSIKHIWFEKSSKGSSIENSTYSDYYYWKQNANLSPYATNFKDTNILYWHKKDTPNHPILNWKSSHLKEAMFEVFKFWISKGVDGFYLSSPKYISRSLDATKTDWDNIIDVLQELREIINDYVKETEAVKDKKIFIFTSADEMTEEEKKNIGVNGGLDALVNYELGKVEKDSSICYKMESSIAGCVNEILSDVLLFHNNNPDLVPVWEFGNPYIPRITTRVQSTVHSEILTMLQLMLPGSNLFYYGDIIGMRDFSGESLYSNNTQKAAMQWNDDINGGFSEARIPLVPVHADYAVTNWEKQKHQKSSPLKMFKRIAEIKRRVNAFKLGKAYVGAKIDNAFTLTRFDTKEDGKAKGSVYVCAANFGKKSVDLPLLEIPGATIDLLKESAIVALTTNAYDSYYIRQKVNLESGSLTIGPQQAIIFKFKIV
uniref:Alpha-glucosidase n=1 Tax=Rhabditophanes sp. KR3021 TaxID=114890 RepID=A0AC35TYG0_9BILA